MEESVQQFKVGDRVRILNNRTGGECPIGSICEIKEKRGDHRYGVWTPDKSDDWDYVYDSLAPAEPAPSEIILNGVRYSLTPVQEAAAEPEPKREPKMGEIWRDSDGDMFMIGDERDTDDQRIVMYLTGVLSTFSSDCAYAYPNLESVVASNALS